MLTWHGRPPDDICCRIENGEVAVRVKRSPTADLPGVPFIMSAQTFLNNEDLSQLEGVAVEVSLQPNDTRSLENCSAAAVALVSHYSNLVGPFTKTPPPPA